VPEEIQTATQMTLPEAVKLAGGLLDEHRLSEAERILAAVLQAAPQSVDGLHFMGLLRCQQGRAQEAIELIRTAVSLAPQYAEAHFNLGNILRAMGRGAEAQEAFGRTIELAPEMPEPCLSMADLLRRAGQRAEAVPSYLQALHLDPTLAEAHFQLGKIYYRLGRPSEAAATFRNWLASDPGNPVAQHMVGATGGPVIMDRASDGYVRCEFDDFADTFEEVMTTLGYDAPQQLADALAELVKPQEQLDVLDGGCGTGLVGAGVRPWARHLIGVDLSTGMIEHAGERGIYDELIVAELTAFVESTSSRFDLVVSADTFIYFGDLSAIFRGVGRCLRHGGYFIFSAEHLRDETVECGYLLQPHGRYSQSERYIRRCLADAGLTVVNVTQSIIRLELKEPVEGLIVTAMKPSANEG
jgi:predicted TPR repeat methyltransferase